MAEPFKRTPGFDVFLDEFTVRKAGELSKYQRTRGRRGLDEGQILQQAQREWQNQTGRNATDPMFAQRYESEAARRLGYAAPISAPRGGMDESSRLRAENPGGVDVTGYRGSMYAGYGPGSGRPAPTLAETMAGRGPAMAGARQPDPYAAAIAAPAAAATRQAPEMTTWRQPTPVARPTTVQDGQTFVGMGGNYAGRFATKGSADIFADYAGRVSAEAAPAAPTAPATRGGQTFASTASKPAPAEQYQAQLANPLGSRRKAVGVGN